MPNNRIDLQITTPSFSGSSESSTAQMLLSAIERLNQNINSLNTNMKNIGQEMGESKRKGKPPGEPLPSSDMFNRLTNGLLTATAITGTRLITNQTSALMARATATGKFLGEAIAGNANQVFGSYVSGLVDIERQRRVSDTMAVGQGVGGWLGHALATVGTGLMIAKNPEAKAAGQFMNVLSTMAAGLGGSAGGYAAAQLASRTEKEMLVNAALARRQAEASITEWQTPFSRWGLSMGMANNIGGTGVSVPLSKAFEQKYGSSLNYNQILNNIVPYLNQNPMSSQVGNLDTVAQSFLKAGFAASDFAKLTMQSSQYTAITGKNLEKFGDTLLEARRRFGEGFSADSMQSALNLMSVGYSNNEAQRLAYQSQFNPLMASSANQFAGSSPSDFYANKALSGSLGFDINEAMQFGHIRDPRVRKRLRGEIQDFQKRKRYSRDLMILSARGISPAEVSGWAQDLAPENMMPNRYGVTPDKSPAQAYAQDQSMLNNLTANAQNMLVNAQNVTVVGNTNNPNYYHTEAAPAMRYASPPIIGSNSPTKK